MFGEPGFRSRLLVRETQKNFNSLSHVVATSIESTAKDGHKSALISHREASDDERAGLWEADV
jgi:hypothetical protein